MPGSGVLGLAGGSFQQGRVRAHLRGRRAEGFTLSVNDAPVSVWVRRAEGGGWSPEDWQYLPTDSGRVTQKEGGRKRRRAGGGDGMASKKDKAGVRAKLSLVVFGVVARRSRWSSGSPPEHFQGMVGT